MYFWYKLLTYLFYPFTPFFLFLRKLKKKEHPIRYKEKLSQINTPRGEGFLIWFHVASVGEAMSILPLIENFEQDEKIKKILITSITVSSAEVLKKNLKKDQILIDMSSTKKKTAIEIEKQIKASKGYFLDAPVSGGTIGAEKAKLAIMVGGQKRIFNKVKNLLSTMGKVTYVGKTGSGQIAKLANQAIVGITIGAVSEALILAKAAGANPKAVREAIKTGFAGSPILENHGNRILNGNFKAGGKCSTQLKDMKNIIETARDYNIHLPISNKVKKLYAMIVKQGKSNLDHSALYLLLKRFKKY